MASRDERSPTHRGVRSVPGDTPDEWPQGHRGGVTGFTESDWTTTSYVELRLIEKRSWCRLGRRVRVLQKRVWHEARYGRWIDQGVLPEADARAMLALRSWLADWLGGTTLIAAYAAWLVTDDLILGTLVLVGGLVLAGLVEPRA